MDKERNLDRLEKYIQNDMDREERIKFESELSADRTLANELKFYQNLGKTVEAKRIISNLKKQTTQKKEKPTLKSRINIISIAASFLLIFSLSLYIYSNKYYSNTSLALVTEKEMGLLLSSQNRKAENSDPQKTFFSEGIKAFESANLEDAKNWFQQINSNSSNYIDGMLFIAFIDLKRSNYLESYTVAVKIQKITNDSSNLDYMKAEWLGLKALIGQDKDQDKITFLLKKISSDPNHQYYDQAIILQEKRNSLWRNFIF